MSDLAAPRHAYLDVSAGVAGDMLLAALLDAGADRHTVGTAIGAVAPDVQITLEGVQRAGFRALEVQVRTSEQGQAHRDWADIRAILQSANLPYPVKDDALAVFRRLAEAEAAVHGMAADQVEFHEVGSWDAIADVVGVCAALHDLRVTSLTCGPIAVGSGTVDAAHGRLPVPVPAVLEMARGWEVFAGSEGELATPTGLALLTTLCTGQESLPHLLVMATGIGAGGKDRPGRANIVRVVVGHRLDSALPSERMVLLETNVDDLDPRVWPSVLEAMLKGGAADAWLSPVLMKKSRPAHTLHVLAPPERREDLRDLVFRHTSTLGIREHEVCRPALERSWRPVDVEGHEVRIKVASRAGVVVHASAEYDDVASVAASVVRPVREVLELASAAAVGAGLVAGAPLPQR